MTPALRVIRSIVPLGLGGGLAALGFPLDGAYLPYAVVLWCLAALLLAAGLTLAQADMRRAAALRSLRRYAQERPPETASGNEGPRGNLSPR